MKKNPVEMAMLLDIYGEILTEKQKDFFECYHSHDLSLGEIAENQGITRQGVRDVIGRAEGILKEMEEKLGLVSRFLRMQQDMQCIARTANEILDINSRRTQNSDIKSKADYILNIAEDNLM